MTARTRLLVLALGVLVTHPALAVGPSREVVQERLYRLDGRAGVSVLGAVALSNKLSNHVGVMLQPEWNLTEAWALEGTLAGFLGMEMQGLMSPIRDNVAAVDELDSEFADMALMDWAALASVRWSPVYGKLSLAAEVPLHMSAYAALGGGVVGVRDVTVLGPEGTGSSETRPAVNLAVGLRFFAGEHLSFRTELRDVIHPDAYRIRVGTPEEETVEGLTSRLLLGAGASYHF